MITVRVPGTDRARDAVRVLNKHLLNPLMLRLAGRRFWYAAALHHTGRRSGRAYVTPVVADAAEGGFLIPLPYGTGVDWLANVLASGQATLDLHGRSILVAEPRVLGPDDALPLLPAARAAWWRLLRMSHFLYVGVPDAPRAVAPAAHPASRPDLRAGDPLVHDLVAEMDEAIDAGDEPRVEALSARLHRIAPNAGAGADS